MAFNKDKLIILPFLGQFIIDSDTIKPLPGTITFYKTNKIDLKEIFEQTGDPDVPFQVATNPVQLNIAGGFVNAIGNIFVPYLNPFVDNTDEEELYFVEARRNDNSLAWSLDNFPKNFNQNSNINSESAISNILPSYGFDSKIDDNIYKDNNLPISITKAVSNGWFWNLETSQTTAINNYFFEDVTQNNIEGNPKNKLIVRSSNNTGGKSANALYAILGDYNSFQNKDLLFSIQCERRVGSVNELNIDLVRTNKGIAESSIFIGTIICETGLASQTINFQVPKLDTIGYENDDELRLVIRLPLNVDSEYGFTGTWLQENDALSNSSSITEEAGSLDATKQFFGGSFRKLQSNTQYLERTLPVAIGDGRAMVLNQTGFIFQSGVNLDLNYAVSMGKIDDEDAGLQLLRDNILKNSQTNRLIDYLRTNNMTQSRHTLIAVAALSVVDVTSGIGTAENSAWVSNTTAITVSRPVEALIYKISVKAIGNGNVFISFVDNFNASTTFHNQLYTGTPNNLPVFSGVGFSSNPIINWYGDYYFPTITPTTGTSNDFFPFIKTTVISSGSATTKAKVKINFINDAGHYWAKQIKAISITDGVFQEIRHQYNNIYNSISNNNARITFTPGGQLHDSNIIKSGFLSYNDISSNVTPQPAIPPRLIRFTVDGVGDSISGALSTVTVPIVAGDANYIIARKLSKAINTSFKHVITIVSVPANGDTLEISNDQIDFIIIYYNTTQTKPSNPSSKVPIFVEFISTQTITEIALSTANAIESAVMGVPRAADLGLPMTEDLEYYMNI